MADHAVTAGIPVGAPAHPAPARGQVAVGALWFGLAGAPVAWSVQTVANLAIASHACFPQLHPLRAPTPGGVRGVLFAVGALALAVCVAACATAWRAWRRTHGEHQEGAGRGRAHGTPAALLETGEGRTRFMALAGVLASATFTLVSAVNVATVFLVPPCGG